MARTKKKKIQYRVVGKPDWTKLASKFHKMKTSFIDKFPKPPTGRGTPDPIMTGKTRKSKLIQYKKGQRKNWNGVIRSLEKATDYAAELARNAEFVRPVND